MENKKKTIFNVVFLLVVFVGTIYGVFYGEDLGEIAQIIKTVNPLWLIPGVACVVVFIWGESIIIYYMMHTLGIRLKKRTCFLFSSVGFFFSCITPSASGGQPAQIYYMKKEKIPIPVSTLVLMIVTITYKLVLVVIGVAPSLIAYRMGMNHIVGIAILMFYVLAGLIRLAWFNVSEEIRQNETEENRECYQGLPITSMAIALPILVVFRPLLEREFIIALHALVLVIGLLFITNFRLRKPKKLGQTIMVIIVALAVLRGLHVW